MFTGNVMKTLSHVYTVSENTLRFYLERYPAQKDKFSFLPTWADKDLFSGSPEPAESIRKKLALTRGISASEGPWILFVGRLQKVKAPFRMVDAFREFYKEQGRGTLVIIGEGNLRQKLVDYVKSIGLDKQILFLGQIQHDLLPYFYRASDILILTSESEGMPRSVLEALGCGTPVVTTNVGEVARVVKNDFSGEIISDNSPGEISRGIIKVLSRPGHYTKDNCVNAISEFTPQKVLSQVYDYLRQEYLGAKI